MQTRVLVDMQDNGKSVRMGVGDILEVTLPQSDASARWQAEVDTDVLAPLATLTSTQDVWILDDAGQRYQRSFGAAREGHTVLKMSHDSVEDGSTKASFALEVLIGNATYPKAMRQPVPAPELVVILCEFMLVAILASLLSFLLVTHVVASQTPAMPQLILGLLGTVGMATIAGFLAVRIISILAGRVR